MRVPFIREMTYSWKIIRDKNEWKTVWDNARVEAYKLNTFRRVSNLGAITVFIAISSFFISVMLMNDNILILLGSGTSFVLAMYFNSERCRIIDDCAIKIYRNRPNQSVKPSP